MAHTPHLFHVLASFGVAGIQVRLTHVINRLGPRYRHTIIALDGITSCLDRVEPGNLVAALPFPRKHRHGPLAQLWRIRHELATHAPDVLLTYNWGAIEWALANRYFPLSAHIHFEDGFGPEEADAQLRRRVLVRRFALGGASKIVVPSQTLLHLALRDWRFSPKHVLHIPNGIDSEVLAVSPRCAPPFARDEGDVVVGTVAPLRPEKNLARLIRAVAQAGDPRLRLVVAGDGKERSALERQARKLLGDRVQFLGTIAQPSRVLQNIDIFALSSDTEQMPMTILEAGAMGLPIAAVSVGDVPRMIAHENSPFIVNKCDEDGLAAAIRRLAADPALRSRLGWLNQRHVRAEFPLERMITSYEELLMSVTGPARDS